MQMSEKTTAAISEAATFFHSVLGVMDSFCSMGSAGNFEFLIRKRLKFPLRQLIR
jgi:hypothetical protein